MIFKHGKLHGDEITMLKETISDYKDFDRLDFLIAISLKRNGTSFKEFKKRTVEKKEIKIEVQQMDESLKYCTSDKCQIVYTKC